MLKKTQKICSDQRRYKLNNYDTIVITVGDLIAMEINTFIELEKDEIIKILNKLIKELENKENKK